MDNCDGMYEFMAGISEGTKAFNSFAGIFEKAKTDGYLHCIHLTLNNIFDKEIKFAIDSFFIRTFKNETK